MYQFTYDAVRENGEKYTAFAVVEGVNQFEALRNLLKVEGTEGYPAMDIDGEIKEYEKLA